MSGPLDPLPAALELLDRSLAYTRVALAAVRDDALGAPTPCRGWDLAQLLAHMDDALDAFTEGAGGAVAPVPPDRSAAPTAALRVHSLQTKACALLGAWSAPVPDRVRVGDRDLRTATVAAAAALEVTTHGWDVARALRLDHPVPEALARALLPVAHALVASDDRPTRFGPALVPADTHVATRLLAHLGRDRTGPGLQERLNRGTGPGLAS